MSTAQESNTIAINSELTKLKLALIDRKQCEPLKFEAPSRRTPATRVPRHPKRTYAAIAGFMAGNASNSTTQSKSSTSDGSQVFATSEQETNINAKVKITGARRIWGTLETCSPGAISTKLVPTTGPLRVRRKTKRLVNKSVWWFVVI